MNPQNKFCRTMRFVHRASLLPKVLTLGVPAMIASSWLTYDAGSQDALGALAVGGIVCIVLTPALFLGRALTVGRQSRAVLSLALSGAAVAGGVVGLLGLAGRPSPELLFVIPMAFMILFVSPVGWILLIVMIGSGLVGSYIGDRLASATAILPGACRVCGYDLTNLASERCPECGELKAGAAREAETLIGSPDKV